MSTFDLSKVAAASVPLPSEAIANYLFDPRGPKFLFDDIYHFSMRHYARHQNNRNMLPVVKLMLSTVINHMADQNSPMMLIPEAITNGKLYYDLAEKHEARIRESRDGMLTTYRMGEILNKGELGLLTEKNKNRAMKRLEGFQKLNPDALVVSPTGMEAMLKTLIHEPGFSNYQMLRDEDFEAFWIGVCFASKRGGFSDEVAYSRNGNFETFALFQTRYGIVPIRPKADTDIVFPNGKSVTPHDYTQMLFAHLLDVVPRGFTSDLSVKMAMRMIMLEEMRTQKMAHPVWGKLDPHTMNSDLRDLSQQHDKQFRTLKSDMLKFMLEHNLGQQLGDMAGLDGYDGLEKYYFEKLEDIGSFVRGAPMPRNAAHVKKASDNLDMDAVLQKKALVDPMHFQIPYQLDGEFFCKKSPLFEQGHFSRCTQVEQIALRTFMGLVETPKLCPKANTAEQGGIFVLVDRRGGQNATEYAVQSGFTLPAETRGLKGSFDETNFEDVVKSRNIEKSNKIEELLKFRHPSTIVTSLEQIEKDFDTFRINRKAFVAPGPDKLSLLAKTTYGEEILRRSTRIAVFDSGWENSNILIDLRMHARKIQLGLIDRPVNMMRHSLTVADEEGAPGNYTSRSLKDDLETLTLYMKKLANDNTESYPRPLVNGLLQTVTFINLYYNEDMNMAANAKGDHGLINWQSVPMAATQGLEKFKEEVLLLKEEARDLIMTYGMGALTLEDVEHQVEKLDPDYAQAKRRYDANQKISGTRSTRQSSYQKIRGFNAA